MNAGVDGYLFAVIAIIAVAAFIKSAIGIGEAVIAVPILAHLLSIRTAIPLVGLMSLTLVLLLLVRNYREIELSTVRQLFLGCLFGIPAGLYFLKTAPEALLLLCLGVLLVIAGGMNLLSGRVPSAGRRLWAGPFGFVAGAFTAAYAIGGPPVFLYGALKGWDSKTFRISSQSFFMPLCLVVVSGHGAAGLWSKTVVHYYLMALPGLLAAFWLGNHIGGTLKQETFKAIIHWVLVVQGLLLIARNLGRLLA